MLNTHILFCKHTYTYRTTLAGLVVSIHTSKTQQFVVCAED